MRRAGPGLRPRGLAALAAALTCALYAWGLLHVVGAVLDAEDGGTDSAPPRPCRSAPRAVAPGYLDHHVDLLPLRFVCDTESAGGDTADTVPPYVNPALLVTGLTTVGLGVCAVVAHERDERRRAAVAGAR
ncbi:hypothetical protein V2W30_12990 [Streptomyces sp. Q6]|uniref:Uncharacterized protein n=1 Tax=Streptomyces citrinus TaxID=3118173 RepID=A0ACD5AAB9_9ACTN